MVSQQPAAYGRTMASSSASSTGVGGGDYVKRQKSSEEQKTKELEAMRKEVDAMVTMVEGIRVNLERVPTQLDALVAGFGLALRTLSANYDMRDTEKPTTPIVGGVNKTCGSMETELAAATRTAFHEHTFTFLKNWTGKCMCLSVRVRVCACVLAWVVAPRRLLALPPAAVADIGTSDAIRLQSTSATNILPSGCI